MFITGYLLRICLRLYTVCLLCPDKVSFTGKPAKAQFVRNHYNIHKCNVFMLIVSTAQHMQLYTIEPLFILLFYWSSIFYK